MKRKSFWLTLLISLLLSAAIGTVLLSLGRLEPTAISAAAWDSIAKVGEMLPLIGMTILVALGLYTFSLFCFKPQETYLREFLIFQGVILLRYMAWYLHLFPLSWEVRRWISPAITWTIALLILKISVLLSGTRLSGFWKKALSWPWLLIWGTVLFLLWPQEGTSRHFRNLTVFLISLVFLCQGSSQKERGVRWCLAGMVILLGVYYSMIANYFVEQHNPLFYYLNRLYFIDVPFILGTMVCVNSKFAWAFTEKERLSANLEEMVEERTRQIKELQAERHSMITNIFHDLRTPLFVIGNGLEVLESNPEALPEMLPILQQRSHFAKELTEDLFLLIKLQDGKVVLSQQRVPLSDIVSSLSSSLRASWSIRLSLTMRSATETGSASSTATWRQIASGPSATPSAPRATTPCCMGISTTCSTSTRPCSTITPSGMPNTVPRPRPHSPLPSGNTPNPEPWRASAPLPT